MKARGKQWGNSTVENHSLTGMEVEVLSLLARGMTRKEISEYLSLSTHTVNTHLEHTYQKMGIRNAAAAVAIAIREHLI